MARPPRLPRPDQHELGGAASARRHDGGTGYLYTDWSIPPGPFMGFLRDLGEASLLYPLAGQPAPKIHEMREVHTAICALYAGAERQAPSEQTSTDAESP